MILAPIGQCTWTVYATVHAARGQLHLNVFFTTHLRVKSIFFTKSSFLTSFLNFVIVTINWWQDFVSASLVGNHTHDETNRTATTQSFDFFYQSHDYRLNWIPLSL